MDKKSVSTWYKCLFCTRVFPEASQLVAHRKLYHALQWTERKLAKKAEMHEVGKHTSNYVVNSVSPTEHTVKAANSTTMECISHDEPSRNGHSRIIQETGKCSDMECNGNCETFSAEPGVEVPIITISDEDSAGPNNPSNSKNNRVNFIDIKIELNDLFRREKSPERNFNSAESYASSEATTMEMDSPINSPLRKSARLLSPANLSVAKITECIFRENDTQLENKKTVPVCNPKRDVKPGNRFVCSVCYKSFAVKARLSQHEITHLEIKPYKCEFCPKTFAQKGNLETHKMLHKGEFPFQCDSCNRFFRTKAFLTAHGIVHRSDRDFKCLYCQQTFRSKGILKTHSLKLHGVFSYGNSDSVVDVEEQY